MLARPRLRLIAPAFRLARLYSSDATAPLILVKNIPAPGSGHIRVLELNRPEARNAISKALLAALRAEVDDVHAQYTPEGDEKPAVPGTGGRDGEIGPTRALVLASASDASFCAGADLKERRGFTQDETAQFLATLQSTFTSLSKLPIPTISAISSVALGGGLELALCTHFRILASSATVGLPETRLGIIPGAGGTYRLPALIGLGRARDLIVTGRRVFGPEAFFLGIADRLVDVSGGEEHTGSSEQSKADPAELARRARDLTLSEALRFATEVCHGGPIAIRAALQAVSGAREDVENAMYQRVVKTEDRDEALAAFKEKRKPVFKGR